MSQHRIHARNPITLAVAAALAGTLAVGVQAEMLEEVVVTAQKREQSLQEVPIAVTAYDAGALEARQINQVADVRFSAPNVSYSKDNFVGSNFKIRGVGADVTAAASDTGVGVHVNGVPLQQPRLFQTEYYDIESLEILRGPQGTLFGRNSTGGSVNMRTALADPSQIEGNLEGEYGSYNHKKVKGAVNLPLTDTLAVRLAGIALQRDGYSENIATGNDIDGRDQWSGRFSLHWAPTDATTVDFMASYMEENSTRSRSQKQLCKQDPTGLLGCSPDALAFENTNPNAQLTGTLPSLLGPLAPELIEDNGGVMDNPADLRKVAADFDPVYEMDESLFMLTVQHDFNEHSLTVKGSYHETTLLSQQDFNMNANPNLYAPSSLLPFVAPNANALWFADGKFPTSSTAQNNTGIIGGNVAYRGNTLDVYDQSNNDAEEYSFETYLASDKAGKLNYLVGLFYLDAKLSDDYWVVGTGLDYFAAVFPATQGFDGAGWVSPTFRNQTNEYHLKSSAAFGELYYDFTETVKLTVGARYTHDKKTINDQSNLFNNDPVTGLPVFVAPGTEDWSAQNPPRTDEAEWKEWTGRIVLDWAPEVSFTDETLVYTSLSRGYKGGGFNPAISENQAIDYNETYDPEYVNAFEVGTKNRLLDGSLQANLTGFYYDYEGLQVSKITDRTSFNENTNSEIYGVEAEFVFAPTENWLFNTNLAYLKTEVQDFASVDPRDPTQGRTDVTLIKDVATGSNCVIEHNGAPAPIAPGPDQFSSCAALAGALPAPYAVVSGVETDLSGNVLPNSPELTFSFGAQYTFDLSFADLSLRADYYWQDAMYGRIYNRDIDKIDSWDVWNAQAILRSKDDTWFARGFVKNLTNENNVVGMYVSDASAGLFTNVFLIDPRVYGLAIGYNF